MGTYKSVQKDRCLGNLRGTETIVTTKFRGLTSMFIYHKKQEKINPTQVARENDFENRLKLFAENTSPFQLVRYINNSVNKLIEKLKKGLGFPMENEVSKNEIEHSKGET